MTIFTPALQWPEFFYLVMRPFICFIKSFQLRLACHWMALILLSGTTVVAQQANLKGLLEGWRSDHPQEKVFVQTDKTHYFPGETIYLKAWCVLDGEPTYLSRILYVDLVDGTGKVINKKMYKLDSLGSTAGDLEISKDLAGGKYAINAYTLWMLNFPGFIATKNIYLYAADYIESSRANQKPQLYLHFFPEGGQWVAGVPGRMAFKATDQSGLPTEVKGAILDNNGKRLYDFGSRHDGMGVIEYEAPDSTMKYHAEVTDARGILLRFPLPEVEAKGVVMRVENTSPSRIFVLLNMPEQDKAKYKRIHLVAQMHGQVCFQASLNIEEGELAAPIGKKNLPPGIIQITAFDENNRPLAERLAFVAGYKTVAPVVLVDSVRTKPRARSEVSFTLDSVEQSSLSVLVTEGSFSGAFAEESIVSAMLFTSDLKGYIHNPGQYFVNQTEETLGKLDLLLMTHGWRRFVWKDLVNQVMPPIRYPVESSLSITGRMTKSDRDAPINDGYVSFIIKSKDSASILAEAKTNEKGEFLLPNLEFRRSATVAYMGTSRKKENFIVDVKLNPAYIDSLSRSKDLPTASLDTTDLKNRKNSWANYLASRINLLDTPSFSGFNFLGNVVVTGKKMRKEDSLNHVFTTGPFSMGFAVDPAEFKYYTTVWQIVQASVPGVTVEGDFYDPKVSFNRYRGLDMFSNMSTDETYGFLIETNGIAYYLNEVNVSKDVINALHPRDVALIKALKNEGAMLGATAGVLAFYTNPGAIGVGRAIYEKNYTAVERTGYAVTREFYMPDYTAVPDLNKSITDSRYTLFWNPGITPSRDGRYRFHFHNNDLSKKFRLTVQGISRTGQLIHYEKIVE
jgi:hypothetical protein